jgi:plasmid stabilization system protein ParE
LREYVQRQASEDERWQQTLEALDDAAAGRVPACERRPCMVAELRHAERIQATQGRTVTVRRPRLVYTAAAVGGFARLRTFIAEHDTGAARRIAAGLPNRIEALRDAPLMGRAAEFAPDPESIRDLVFGNCIVRYPVTARSVAVLRVWHHFEPRRWDARPPMPSGLCAMARTMLRSMACHPRGALACSSCAVVRRRIATCSHCSRSP